VSYVGIERQSHSFRRNGWILFAPLLVTLLCFVGTSGTASAGRTAATAWGDHCSPNDTQTGYWSIGLRCIAGAELSSRGWFNPVCLEMDPLPGTIYPSTGFCKGRGGGPEAIEQARAVAHLDSISGPGIDPNVQWEVGLRTSTLDNKYADLVFYDHSDASKPLQLWELKTTANSDFANRGQQMQSYLSLISGVVNQTATAGTELASWPDLFLVDTGTPCGPGNALRLFTAYLSWQSAPGLYDTYVYSPPCFDPVRYPVPVPVNVPSWVELPSFSPTIFETPHWAPGTSPTTGPPPLIPPVITTPPTIPHPPIPLPPSDPNTQPPWHCFISADCIKDHVMDFLWWYHDTVNNIFSHIFGEPHIVTLDGLHYDMQSVGEFQAARADEYGLNLQVRFVPAGTSSSVSMAKAVAFELDGHPVEISIYGLTDSLKIDHAPFTLPVGSTLDFGDGAVLLHRDDGYVAALAGESLRPTIWVGNSQFKLYVPPGTNLSGLLGNGDGDPSNDLVTSYGTQLPANASRTTIQGTFADSWRIPADGSLFTYASGESTATYTDRTFPANNVTVGDLSDSTLAAATKQCTDGGVGDGAQFDDCVIDWALTQDTQFLNAAANQVAPAVEGGARPFDTSGAVSETFDSVAPNFSSPRYATGAGTGTFAGPFGRDGRYVFYGSSPPAHSSATVQFDLIAIGDWATNASSNTVKVDVNGTTAWTGAPATGTPSSSGTLPTGQAYAIYPVSVTIPQSGHDLGVGISAVIPVGSSRVFGIDNVHASLALVAPQAFDVTLPLAASNGTPAAGAGNLETIASEDDYRFSTATTGALQVDFTNCTSSLGYYVAWQLRTRPEGDVVASGANCGSTLIPNVAAGQYELAVTRDGATGTYGVAAYSAPAPQTFNVTLPASASNGVPAAGAGNLETTASEDDYAFTTTADGKLQVDFANCTSSLGYYLTWKVVDAATNETIYSKSSCSSTLVPSIPAGSYRLVAAHNGSTGTYSVGISLQATPEYFDVTLPLVATSNSPQTGMGNLETTSSEDNYVFTTTAAGGVQVDFTNCTSSLGYYVTWNLLDDVTGNSVSSASACGSRLITGVPAGRYRLSVSRNGSVGTYNVGILVQPAPQSFDITPPVSISNGAPAAGAGNLETTASEDRYRFTTTSSNDVQLDVSNCSSSLGYYVIWSLLDEQSGNVIRSVTGCGSTRVTGVPAGHYRVAVTRNGAIGTYNLGIGLVPAPDVFNVTLPLTASNGVPGSGAGNLETTSSEDDYVFTTTATGGIQVDLSNCTSSLGYYVTWSLVNVQTSATVYSTSACGSKLIQNVAAGQYKLVVARSGATGTYNLGLLVQPAPQVFDVSLPVMVNGTSAPGAGNLETTASEDDYAFTTAAAGAIQVDLSSCTSSLGYYVSWSLVNAQTGLPLYSTSACASKLVTGVPAGQYRLVVTRNGAVGTYNVGILVQPPTQVFAVSLPASISNGVPSSGAGNLETTASEDDYTLTTAAAGTLTLAFANCPSSLGYYLTWKLVNDSSGATVFSTSACSTKTISALAAGQYRVVVTHNGASGTYTLGLSLGP